MAMYALAVVPLIRQLRSAIPEACQAWFADDATAVGSFFLAPVVATSVFCWTGFGYFPNASKTVIIVKPEYLAAAESIFANTNIQITAQGQQHFAQLWELVHSLKLISHKRWQLGLLKSLLWLVLLPLGPTLLIVPSLMEWLVAGYM